MDPRMSLTASSPSTRQAVGWARAGRSQPARAGPDDESVVRSLAAWVEPGLGLGLGLGLAVGTGVLVGTVVAVGGGVGVPTSGVTGESSARLTVTELGATSVSTRSTAISRRTICLVDISTIMR